MKQRILLLLLLAASISLNAQTTVVGTTEGVFNVSDLGAAAYTIPIKVPKGIGEMQPSLALKYNSQAGNGIIGSGWDLSAISSITRAGNDIYHDSRVNAADITSADKFSLDGNRLVRTGGVYGAANSRYRTEVETFRDITANGTLGNGPQSFTITDQNGWTYQYGGTADSRAFAEGMSTPYQWLLNRVTDLNGNYITYEYLNISAGQAPLLKYINYTANTNILASQSRIVFDYENRPDPNFMYLAGAKITSAWRLQSIRIQEGIYTIRSYNLEYTADLYTRLAKVTERGNENVSPLEQLPPTEMQYYPAVNQHPLSQAVAAQSNDPDGEYITGDYNGDGLLDFVKVKLDAIGRTTDSWELYRNNGNGFALTKTGTANTGGTGSGTGIKIGVTDPYNPAPQSYSMGNNFDYDGDGSDELFLYRMVDNGNGNSVLYLNIIKFKNNGTSYTWLSSIPISNKAPFTGDFDGDGRTEILLLNTHRTTTSPTNLMVGDRYGAPMTNASMADFPTAFGGWTQLNGLTFDAAYCNTNDAKIHVLDYNGDGKSDVLAIWSVYGDVYSFDASFDANSNPVVNQTTAFRFVNRNTNYPTLEHRVFPGDFNGDGAADLATWKGGGTGWQIGYGKANGFFSDIRQLYGIPQTIDPIPDNTPASALPPYFVADFNSDGKSDIYYGGGSSGAILLSKGNHAFETKSVPITASSTPDKRMHHTIGDFNGDGNADLLFHRIFFPVELITVSPNEKRQMVQQITNGLGAVTKVDYASIVNNASVYGTGTGTYTYPYVKRPLPLKVVSLVNTDNGINTTGTSITYKYTGLRFHLHGKGLLGFEQTDSWDALNGITNQSIFGLNTTYASPYLSSAVAKQGTNTLSQTTNTQGIYHYGSKRIFPYISENISQDFTTNTTVKTTNNYTFPGALVPFGVTFSSHIGKPMSVVTDRGNGLDITTQTFTYPGYSNPSGTVSVPVYIYSKPSSITATTTRQGEPAYTRKQQFSYNASTGQVETIVNDPSTTNAVTQTFIYTNYGNVAGITTSAPGVTSRTEVKGYDATQRYLVISYNAAYPNVKRTNVYNAITGNVESTAFSDGFTISNTYDGLSRLKTSSDNNGLQSTTVYGWAVSSAYAPASAKYYVQATSNTGTLTYKYYDRLGRLVRTAYKDFGGTMTYEDIVYNNKGQVAATSKPYFSTGAPQWTNNTYDTRGRISVVARPEGNTTYGYVISGGLYTTTTTNAASQVSKTYSDASGKLRKAEDHGGILEYTYHSNGKAKLVTLAGNVVSQTEYDDFGRQKKTTDPNYGSYEFTYNAYDELLSQKDPKNQTYSYTYNELGKVITKGGPEGPYTYTYNASAGTNCGKLVQITGPGGVTQNYSYGMGDKVTYEERIVGSETFKTQYTYDAYGRPNQTTYPNGTITRNSYSGSNGSYAGVHHYIPSLSNSYWLYHTITKNALGSDTRVYLNEPTGLGSGNPIFITDQQFDTYGLLKEQKTNRYDNVLLRHQYYTFQPATGNLLQRKDLKYGLQEDFGFDNVNRLNTAQAQVISTTTPISSLQLNYSDNGNIEQKSDAGTFGYDQANRVSEIDPFVNIPTVEQKIEYTAFNKAAVITEGPHEARFSYWADGERSKMEVYENGALKKTKYYADDFEKEIDAVTGAVRELAYVYSPQGTLVAIVEEKDDWEEAFYVLTDHLGSVTQILDASGNIAEEKSFDAWGRNRNPQTWAALPPTGVSNGWDRGYTAHEHLPQFGIVNMNGRLYDPLLGRMMEPDPYIMGEGNSQGYNRYSYALNNPLTYTDPSGKFVWIPIAIGAAVGAYSGWKMAESKGLTGWNMVGYIAGGAVIGGVAGLAGGNVAAVIGRNMAFAGGGLVGAGIGGAVGGIISGGGFAALGGGNIAEGAWKGGVSGLAGGIVGSYIGGGIGAFAGGATSGAVGSSLYGGNVEDMARTALMGGFIAWAGYQVQQNAAYRSYKSGGGKFTYRQFAKISAAAQRSFARGKEFGGWILKNGDVQMWNDGADGDDITIGARPANAKGEFHTHPNWGRGWVESLSPADFNTAFRDSYVIGRQNTWLYNPTTGAPQSIQYSSMNLDVYPYYLYLFGGRAIE